MKQLQYIGMTLLALSCSKGAAPVEETAPVQAEKVSAANENPNVFHASFDVECNQTRTMLSEDLEFLWNEDDEISMFCATTYNREFVFDGMDGSEAGDFYEINSPEERGVKYSYKAMDKNYAVYPYKPSKHVALSKSAVLTIDLPDVQTYRENSVGPGANIMTAVTKDADSNDLVFKNVCGFLKLNLYGEDVVLKSLTITSGAGEKLSGRATIPLGYGIIPVIQMQSGSMANDYVTITSEDGIALGSTKETATAFWFVIPPTVFSSGFTLTATGFYGGTFSKRAPLNFRIDRNTYFNVVPLQVTLSGGAMGVGMSPWDASTTYAGSTE